MPKVSIIVPVYKTEKYIEQCIQSLINQTYQDIEIILVNDGSPDKSGEICDRYANEYPLLITVIHQKNQGTSVARNSGIAASSGEWIAFADSDDWMEPELIEKLLLVAESTQCDICISGYVTNHPKTSVPSEFIQLNGYQLTDRDKFRLFVDVLSTRKLEGAGEAVFIGRPYSKLYRKSFLEINNIWFSQNVAVSQDSLFNMYAIQLSSKTILCEGAYYQYRIHETQTTQRYNGKALLSAEKLLKEVRIFAESFYFDGEEISVYDARAVQSLLRTVSLMYMAKDAPYSPHQRIRGIREVLNHDIYKNSLRRISWRSAVRRQQRIQIFFLKYTLPSVYFIGMRIVEFLKMISRSGRSSKL